MAKKKILISGAGPAGLTTAILLDKSKYDVTVVERASDFLTIGFAILLWQAGYEVLEKTLGHEPQDLHQLSYLNIYGGPAMEKLQSIPSDGGSYSILRSKLIAQLADRFKAKLGSEHIRFNTEIATIAETDDSKNYVTFNTGKEEIYDAVLLADGMHSSLRNEHFASNVKTYDINIDYAWIESDIFIHGEAIIGYVKGHTYLIQSVGDQTLLALFNSDTDEERKDFLDSFAKTIDIIPSNKIVLDEKTARRFNFEKVTSKCAYKGSIVLLGDSLHGHPPTIAMGTTLALEDAYVLAESMNKQESLLSAFQDYERKRRPRINDFAHTQDLVDKFFITDSDALVAFDTMMIKHGAWPFIEKKLRAIFTHSVV